MLQSRVILGHSVSITGYRLGYSILWNNKIVSLSESQYRWYNILNLFCLHFFYNKFIYRRRRSISFVKRLFFEYYGILLESIYVSNQYNRIIFFFNIYIDLLNFVYKKILKRVSTSFAIVLRSRGSRPIQRVRKRNQTLLNKRLPSIFRSPSFMPKRSRTRMHNWLVLADNLVREKRFLNYTRRKKRFRYFLNSGHQIVKTYSSQYEHFLFLYLRSKGLLNRKEVVQLYRPYTFYFDKLWYKFVAKLDKYLFAKRFFIKHLSFLYHYLKSQLRSFQNENSSTVILNISNSFLHPNVLSQFVVLKLRKWYKIGEIFGFLKRFLKSFKTFNGLFIQAKGRLTKRQRASTYRLRVGSTKFSTIFKPLFFFNKVYPLKYGASSISICLTLRLYRI